METQKPPTIENPRPSKLAVIAFIPGSIVGMLIGSTLDLGVRTFEPLVTEPFTGVMMLMSFGVFWLLFSLIWRIPRRIIKGGHRITTIGSLVGGFVSSCGDSIVYFVLVRADMFGYGVVRNDTEGWIAMILMAVAVFVGVELEAWISRKRLRFSIRTMLILVAVVAVAVTGGRWFKLSNTFYRLDALVTYKQGQSYIYINRPPTKYDEIYLSNMFLYKDESMSTGSLMVLYQSNANYSEVKQRSFELRQQLIEVVEQNPDLQFDRYIIRSDFDGTKLETIEEGGVQELLMSSKSQK